MKNEGIFFASPVDVAGLEETVTIVAFNPALPMLDHAMVQHLVIGIAPRAKSVEATVFVAGSNRNGG